jgi:uncharacterized protein YkwD
MSAAGYTFTGSWGWGENIAWKGTTGTPNLTQFVIDNHNALFIDAGVTGRGHRINLMNASFREVGLSSLSGQFTEKLGLKPRPSRTAFLDSSSMLESFMSNTTM